MRFITAAAIVVAVGALLMAPRGLPAQTAPATATGRSDPAKLADIRELIKLSGQPDLAASMTKKFVDYFKQYRPDVPDEFWQQFAREIDPAELGDLMVPIYDHHFSHDDIKELVKFWKSPIGQKLSKEQQAINDESMRAAQVWGQRLAEKVTARLQKAGYGTPATATAPATAPAK